MDATTRAVYRQAIELYEAYLSGTRANVIDPDGSKPSKKVIKVRIRQLKDGLI